MRGAFRGSLPLFLRSADSRSLSPQYGNVLTVSSEMFWVRSPPARATLHPCADLPRPTSQYGVLDFLTRVVWLFAFLFAIEGLAYERFGFVSPVLEPDWKRD